MANAATETVGYVEESPVTRDIGAESSLEEIYDSYADSLFRYAVTITGSAEDSEDAVQEVFTRLARDRQRARRAQNLKAYLFTATRNSAFSILRGRKRRREVQESVTGDAISKFCDPNLSTESVEICRAFAELPVEQREVLTLKIYDEMTFKEIAKTVGASMGTVTARYRYGIAKLRRSLEEDSDG